MHRGRLVFMQLLIATIVGGGFSSSFATPAIAQSGGNYQALERLQRTHREEHEKVREKLVDLAVECVELGLRDRITAIRKMAEAGDATRLEAAALPRQVQPEIPLDLAPAQVDCLKRLHRVREEHAQELHLLSRSALRAGYPSLAYRLVNEVALFDPDHRVARRILGYVRDGDEWVTPFEKRKSSSEVRHAKFGWLPKSHVERYEQGDRYFKGRWMTAAQEAEIRRDFRNAWEIETEHYLVKTNYSLERGVEVARMLETYYGFFTRTFAGFFESPEQLRKRFAGGSSSSRVPIPRQHVVHYYATREEYDRTLIDRIPQIAITNGLYYTTDRVSYFFHDEKEDNEATLYHEATHQLFYEAARNERTIADDANFWIIEGIACYMESFRIRDGELSVGDPKYIRFVAARYRYLEDEYYVPLRRFASGGMHAFQHDPNIARNYSLASGLAHFFMHYDGGRYRDALVTQLAQLYAARPVRVHSLAQLTGVSFGELDRQYGEYIHAMEQAVKPD